MKSPKPATDTIYPHIKFDDIGQWWIFTTHYYAVFWQPFWKWQTSWKFSKRKIAPLMVTYHYVKLYVSIIIQLEVFQWEMIVGALKKFKFDMFGLDHCLFVSSFGPCVVCSSSTYGF